MLHLVDENAKVHAVQRVYAVISSRENALHRFNDARLESTLATANGRSSSRSPRASLGRLRRPSTSALGEAVPQGCGWWAAVPRIACVGGGVHQLYSLRGHP